MIRIPIVCLLIMVTLLPVHAQQKGFSSYSKLEQSNAIFIKQPKSNEPNLASRLSADDWIHIQIASRLRHKSKISEVRQDGINIFAKNDIDGGGVSASDQIIKDELEATKFISRTVGKWASWDLNGDGHATRKEIQRSILPSIAPRTRKNKIYIPQTPEQRKTLLDERSAEILSKWDGDKDGIIKHAEVIAAAREQYKSSHKYRNRHRYAASSSLSPLLDTNKDGTISLKEYTTILDRVISAIDINKNNIVDGDEKIVAKKRSQLARKIQNRQHKRDEKSKQLADKLKNCNISPTPDGTRLIYLDAYAGNGIATTSLGKREKRVGVVDIEIESGMAPLNLVVHSRQSLIWRVSGAIERVTRITASSDQREGNGKFPLVGVVGIKKELVSFVNERNCFDVISRVSYQRQDYAQWLKKIGSLQLFGRLPDQFLASEKIRKNGVVIQTSISKFSVPSGKLHFRTHYDGARKIPTTGASAPLWEYVRRYFIDIIEIDPASVIAPVKVDTYKILPTIAGTAQLIDQGIIEPVEWRDANWDEYGLAVGGKYDHARKNKPTYFRAPVTFKIVKPMRFPLGNLGSFTLGGPHLVLAKDVPKPLGPVGGACVTSEETGKLIMGHSNRDCR